MAKLKYKDNAASLLTVAVLNTDVPASLVLTSGTGAKFPALSAGQWFPLIVVKAATLAFEEMRATARSTDTITATRAQGGTTALSFDVGDVVYLGSTASFLDEFLMTEDAQGGKPHWLGLVTGTNTLTAGATPTVTAYAAGQLFSFQAELNNMMAVTINIDGVGAASIIDTSGNPLTANTLKADGLYLIQYNGADFMLLNNDNTTLPTSLTNMTLTGTLSIANAAIDLIPAGMRITMFQVAIPAGWTLVTGINEYVPMIRNTNTVAGAGSGTWTISGLTAAAHRHAKGTLAGSFTQTAYLQAGAQWGYNGQTVPVTITGETADSAALAVSSTGVWRPLNLTCWIANRSV